MIKKLMDIRLYEQATQLLFTEDKNNYSSFFYMACVNTTWHSYYITSQYNSQWCC